MLGFEDGTFRGNDAVTGEQVLALASRTISEKNGYLYPDKVDTYLSFAEDNSISGWAEKEAALAVREGIYDPEAGLKLKEPIDRKNAAVILYRLFMIMNNTPPMAVSKSVKTGAAQEHKSFWTVRNVLPVLTGFGLIDAAAVAALVIFVRKNKKSRRKIN